MTAPTSKLCPREPTQAMVKAMKMLPVGTWTPWNMWRAMYDAAPVAPAPARPEQASRCVECGEWPFEHKAGCSHRAATRPTTEVPYCSTCGRIFVGEEPHINCGDVPRIDQPASTPASVITGPSQEGAAGSDADPRKEVMPNDDDAGPKQGAESAGSNAVTGAAHPQNADDTGALVARLRVSGAGTNVDDVYVTITKRDAYAAAATLTTLRDERDTFYMDYRMKCDAGQKAAEAEVARLTRERDREQQGLIDYAREIVALTADRDALRALIAEAQQ